MAGSAIAEHNLSPRRIIGFACNQAFIFLMLFRESAVDLPFERFDLACLLFFMVLGFACVRALGPNRFEKLFAQPLLYIYAVIGAVGLLPVQLFPDSGVAGVVLQGLFVGVPNALLLTAWGRSFGGMSTRVSVPEVFLGSLVGALVFLVFSLTPSSPIVIAATCLLPVASAVNIEIPEHAQQKEDVQAQSLGRDEERASALSVKVLAGALLYGMAAGLMLPRLDGFAGMWPSSNQVGFILYGAFLIGALTLLLSDGFGRGASLNKSYRLAVFVLMVGVLLAPWPLLSDSALPGEAVVLAGSLGLETVLISLFLVLAEISGTDCALSFSTGFALLFIGELVGVLASAGAVAVASDALASYGVVVLAGVVSLLSYVFLFTERDFDALSQLVSEGDSLGDVCAHIVERFGLSNREAEVLAFALRGRTSERIAQELVISKSTVDTHLRRIYAKCDVHSRQELLDLAEASK